MPIIETQLPPADILSIVLLLFHLLRYVSHIAKSEGVTGNRYSTPSREGQISTLTSLSSISYSKKAPNPMINSQELSQNIRKRSKMEGQTPGRDSRHIRSAASNLSPKRSEPQKVQFVHLNKIRCCDNWTLCSHFKPWPIDESTLFRLICHH